MQTLNPQHPAPGTRQPTSDPHRDLLSYRDEFPILQNKLFLNTCSLGALSHRSIAAVNDFLRLWQEMGASAWYETWVGKLAELRAAYGRVIGATADRIALAPSISVAVSSVASALDWQARPKVVMSDLDFPTVGHGFLAKRRLGVEVEIVRSPDRITVPLDLFEAAIDERTALVITSHVYFTSGAIQDIAALSEIAHRKGALLLVDAYQGTGQLPTDVETLGADFYASGSLKWLLGGPGIAFLYAHPRVAQLEPTITGWFGMANMFDFDISTIKWRDEAMRFEMGTPAVAAVYAALGGLSIIEEVGVQRIRERDIALTEDLIARAQQAGFSTRTAPTHEERTPIVLVNMEEPRRVVSALAQRGIVVDYRPGAVRISPYFYNTFEENEAVIQAIKEVV
jgi:selenocysteine lyase/cysteine desulfurase